jgi:hypothetical protein
VTDQDIKQRQLRRSVASGLVLAAPMAAAALASVIVGSSMPVALERQPHSTSVSVVHTTVVRGATDPKIPEAVGD